MKDKICPILAAGLLGDLNVVRVNSNDLAKCRKSGCAWWLDKEKVCVIVLVTYDNGGEY